MLKAFWKFALCTAVVLTGGHAIAQTLNAVPIRQPLWSLEMGSSSVPTATATQLFVVDNHSIIDRTFDLYALDPSTGKQLWKSDRRVKSLISVENQTLYAEDIDPLEKPGYLITLNAETGKTQSVIPITDRNFNEVLGVSQGAFIYKSSILRDSEPYQNQITAQTPEKLLWTFNTPANSQVAEGPGLIQDGVVILPILVNPMTPQPEYHLTALDAKTGKLLWQWKSQEETFANVLGDTVYVFINSSCQGHAGNDMSCVKAFDLKTGKERWTHSMQAGQPQMANDREVFVRDYSKRSAIRYVVLDQQTGKRLRELTLTAQVPDKMGPPQLVGNRIYIPVIEREGYWGSTERQGWIEAFDATTRQLKWRTPTLRNSHIYRFTISGDRLTLVGSSTELQKGLVQTYTLNAE